MKKIRIVLLCCLLTVLFATVTLAAEPVSFLGSITGTEAPVSGMEFTTAKRVEKQTVSPTSEEKSGISSGNMVLASLTIKAEKACTPLTLTVCGKTMTYYVPTQWSKIVLAAAGDKNMKVKLEPEAPILVGGATFENCKKKTYEDVAAQCGMFLLEPYQYTALPETGVGMGVAKDLLKSGNFLYVLCDDGMQVVDVSNPDTPKLRGKVTGLGANTRQIAMCTSGQDIMITARAAGVFIVNVADPDKPYLRSAYNSIEMATGLATAGNYAFVCNRQNGVEVVDISDLNDPKEIAIIRTGEVQSCLARKGILYCGLWNECRVDLYDISNPAKAKKLGTAPLNGKGDGVSVQELNGHIYLYAATGQHTVKLSGGPYDDPRYGMGNGLDIYDVTDPTKPVWLSTSKIDGRYYYQNNDMWTVKTAVGGGKVYAYVANTYNGVFVFDVTDPKAPIRVEKVDIPIPKDSKLYALQDSGSNRVFPYDQSVAGRSPVGGLWPENGYLYLAGVFTDLHVCKGGHFYAAPAPADSGVKAASGDYYKFDGSALPGYAAVSSGSLISAVECHDGHLFTAAGSKGILVYDRDLKPLNTIPTEGICYDLAIHGDTLYAALGITGVTAYKINGISLEKQWEYLTPKGVCRGVEISATGKFLALQTGANWLEIISTKTKASVLQQKGTAQMYYRNLLTMNGGRYLGAWSNNGKEYWYDCGENDKNDAPKLICTIAKTPSSMACAAAEYRGRMLALASDGYSLYDPRTTGDSVAAGAVKANSKLTGKPTIFGNLLIATDRIYGHVYLADISQSKSPQVLLDLPVPGSPDFALVQDGAVYLPMGYQGLIKFDLAPWIDKVGLPFADVKESDWFYEDVKSLYTAGIVGGMTDTTFAPKNQLTYGQALKLIVCGLGKGEQATTGAHWASGYLTYAKEQKWLDADVDLNGGISRLAFCQIAAKAKGLTEQPTANPFKDCADKDVLALVNAGIINGMSADTFAPDSTLTRGQISKIINGLIK